MPENVPFLDLARQHRGLRDELAAAVERVLASGWFVLGAEVAAFERAFAASCGAAHAVGVGSGTDALTLALRACGVLPGDGVVTVPCTAVPTVSAIVAAGATPVFVDVDPGTLTLDAERLRERLEAPSAIPITAVIAVHLYGHPADLYAILDVAREHELAVIEDAAHAHGTEYDGRPAGVFGHAGCFSFHPAQTLGACGDAGIVVTSDARMAERLRMLRNHGEEAKSWSRIEGVNSRLDELHAAMLSVKLRHLDAWVAARRRLAALYDTLLSEAPVRRPVETRLARASYHLYVVRSRERDRLRRHLQAQGIGTSVHYATPVHLQPAYAPLGYAAGSFPESERAGAEVLSLPLYPELSDAEVHRVADAVRSF